MILIPINKVRNAVRQYLKHKIPFTYSVSLHRITVRCDKGSCGSNNNRFPPGELHFIKQVKNHVLNNGLHYAVQQNCTRQELNATPVYFAYNKQIKIGEHFRTVYNVDMKSAYWETAYRLGLLSDQIYYKGKDEKQISKKTRLAAIGSLARKVTVYQFDGKEQKLLSDEQEETNFLWNLICSKVGNILTSVAKDIGKDFIFFWVDGIYVSSKHAAEKVERLFKEHGYDSSVTKLVCADVTKTHINVKTGVVKKKYIDGQKIETDIKPFYYSGRKKHYI